MTVPSMRKLKWNLDRLIDGWTRNSQQLSDKKLHEGIARVFSRSRFFIIHFLSLFFFFSLFLSVASFFSRHTCTEPVNITKPITTSTTVLIDFYRLIYSNNVFAFETI